MEAAQISLQRTCTTVGSSRFPHPLYSSRTSLDGIGASAERQSKIQEGIAHILRELFERKMIRPR
jgi:hypothetical protein